MVVQGLQPENCGSLWSPNSITYHIFGDLLKILSSVRLFRQPNNICNDNIKNVFYILQMPLLRPRNFDFCFRKFLNCFLEGQKFLIGWGTRTNLRLKVSYEWFLERGVLLHTRLIAAAPTKIPMVKDAALISKTDKNMLHFSLSKEVGNAVRQNFRINEFQVEHNF